jgi:hypothetical protein
VPSSGSRTWPIVLWLASTLLFIGAWTELHHGSYASYQLVDTPVYQQYGDEIVLDGKVPYRDFTVEYPPAAVPIFVIPSLGHYRLSVDHGQGQYRYRFELVMLVCALGALAAGAATLAGVGASRLRNALALGAVALAPLLLGSVVLSRFDYWPAALTGLSVALLVARRRRSAAVAIGIGVAAKVYPGVLLPLLLVDAWRARGPREAIRCAALSVATTLLFFVPFLLIAPHGVWASAQKQTGRPLQIETLGSSVLMIAHNLFGLRVSMESSFGSQNLDSRFSGVAATLTTLLQLGALLAIWGLYARSKGGREETLASAAAAVTAFVAFGKVLSPQYLIWLIPLVPLVGGRRGLAAGALLLTALGLTSAYFPHHYWTFVSTLDPPYTSYLFERNLVLAALVVVLAWPGAREEPELARTE